MMQQLPDWFYTESKHTGVDYSNEVIAEAYDLEHMAFRDFRNEVLKIAEDLDLNRDSVVLDIGCGTGGHALALASICKHVYAIDASSCMINILQKKTRESSIKNLDAICSGFLSYQHTGMNIDAVISNVALHHLPDFWKQIAICNLYDYLRPGGRLFLSDIVFDFEPREYHKKISNWLETMRSMAGDTLANESAIHVRDEFSTFDWVLSKMLSKAGFVIDAAISTMPQMKAYLCTKPNNGT